jgi:large subunit ribosomal protein L15
LWSWVLRYEPDYFKKKGFFSHKGGRVNVVNVGELEGLAKKLGEESTLERGEMPFLDLDKMGYDKLLGRGNIQRPLSIRVKSHSESAVKKLEEVGGKIVSEVTSTKGKSV